MTFREAVLPFFQFISEQFHAHDVTRRLRTPSVIVTTICVVLSLFLIRSLSQNTANLALVVAKQNENISKLEALQKTVDKLQNTSTLAQGDATRTRAVLGLSTALPSATPLATAYPTPTPVSYPPLGMVQVVNSGQGQLSPVYDDPIKKNVVGRVSAGTILFYSKKSDGWYRVEMPDTDTNVWISQVHITELPK